MPIYEYQGQQYDIADADPTVAKNKILTYLGKQAVPTAAPTTTAAPVADEKGRSDAKKQPRTPAVAAEPTLSPEEQVSSQVGAPSTEVSKGLTEQQKRQLAEATAKYEAETPFMQRVTDPLKAGYASAKGILPGLRVANFQKEINTLKEGTAKDALGRPLTPEATKARLEELQKFQSEDLKAQAASQTEAASYKQRPTVSALDNVETAKQAFQTFQVDPMGVMASVSLESIPQIVPALILGAVTRNPRVGAMAMGSTSFASELSSGITEYFQEQGVNTKDPVAVNKALNDPTMFAKAYEHAMTRASIIGVADTAAAGLASKMLVPKGMIKNQLAKEAVNIGVAQPAAQMISGGGGEAVAQLVTEGEIKKPGQVIKEMAGEGPSSVLETAVFGGQQAYERLPSTIAKREEEAKTIESQKKTLEMLNKPGAIDALGKQFNDEVEKLKASINPKTKQPYTEEEAFSIAGDAILQEGGLDGLESIIGGTDQSSVSVPSGSSGTDTGTTDTTQGNVAATGTTTDTAGSGEGTELNTLVAELKAKYPQLTDEQALKNAQESLRQKQMASGMGTTTTVPQNLKEPIVSEKGAFIPSEVKDEPAKASAGFKTLDADNDLSSDLAGATLITGMDVTDRNKGTGTKLLNSITNWADQNGKTLALIPAAQPDEALGGLDQQQLRDWYTKNGFEDRVDYMVRTPKNAKPTNTKPPVKMGKPRGRPKADKTPEQIAAAAAYRKGRQEVGRNAITDITKAEKILGKVVDEQAIIENSGTEKEAQDTLYGLREERIGALETAYSLSVDPDQKNKAAGKRATALLQKANPQERELGKQRHEAKQKIGAPSRAQISESTNGQDNTAFEKFDFAKGAVNHIARNGNPFERLLAKRLLPFLNGVEFVVVDGPDDMPTTFLRDKMEGAAGLYVPDRKTIYVMREGGINNTVVLHEALHAATVARIDAYFRLSELKEGYTPVPRSLTVPMLELMYLMDSAKQNYDRLKAEALESGNLGVLTEDMLNIPDDAFTDIKEFVAYGMSLPAMQEFLIITPGNPELTYAGEAPGFIDRLFTRFVQSIRQLFDMDESHMSALQDLIIVTDKLLSAPLPEMAAESSEPSAAKAKQPKAPKPPKAPKQLKMVETTLRKLRLSHSSTDMNTSIGQLMMQTRNASDAIRLMKAVYNTISVKRLKLVMRAFTTDDITRIAGDKINNIKVINGAVNDMAGMRTRMIRELAEKVPAWINFNQKYKQGGKALADVINAATLLQVDPAKHPDMATAIKNDPALQRIENDILNPSTDPKTLPNLKKQRTERTAAIKLLYEGGVLDNPITGEKFTMLGWDALGKFGKGEGHDIYKMARDSYKQTFDLHEKLLKEKIASSNVPGDINDASTPKGKLIAAITKTFQEARLLDIYFPLMRYGNFWFSKGKGKSGEFYMFESATARNAAVETRVAELNKANGTNRSLDQMIADGDIDVGDDIRKLREKHVESSDMLKEIFAMLDSNKAAADMDAIKDNIYQMYLMTLPDKDIRRKFVHRQGKTGFSADAIRNFITSQHTAANQLARLSYADKIRNGIAAAYAEIAQNPDKLKLAVLIREISARALDEITPSVPDEGIDWNKVAAAGNKFVFYWLLTSPKSALIQMTQLPIVGLPTLGAEFGVTKAGVTALRYSALWNKFSTTKTDANGNITTEWGQPSIGDSKYVNEHPDPAYRKALKDAWNFANDKDIFMSTYAGDMTAMSAVPTAQYHNMISRGTRGVFNFMGGAFHHAERISREIMFMSSFELAYADYKQKGMDDKAAFDAATEKALQLTYDALFNYTQYNKPRLMKGSPGAKLATQFLTYPLQMTSYLVRNFYGMLPFLNKDEKKEAAIKFFGTLGMTGLFAGVTGFPLYSFIMGVSEGIRELMRDDDEDYDEDDEDNPLGKRNLDLWFRNSFIPSYFGPDSNLASALGLTEEDAATLARGVEMGPLSAVTGLNLGASTSLDGLWFRDDSPGNTSREAFQNFIFGFSGPIGSIGSNIAGAFDDFNNGQINRGFEKLAPAWLRGSLTAYRLGTEGATTTRGDEIVDAEFYTTGKLAAQALGFGNTEVAQIQKSNFMAKQIVTKIEKEKATLLNRLDVAVRNEDDDKVDSILEQVDKFNTKNSMLPISGETISKSLQSREERRGKSSQGLSVTDAQAPFVYPLVEGTRSVDKR